MCVSLAFSQRQVTGTVEDNSGNPIPGASVIVVGTSSGTVTDIEGNFAISVSSGDQLEFSFVGYESQTVTVGAQSTLTITLAESTEFLDEIVVSGYQTQTRKSLSGAIASVDVNNAVKTPVINAAEMLQGRVTGVSIINSGQPGAAPIVRVRGDGTPNRDFLYVEDAARGIILAAEKYDDFTPINLGTEEEISIKKLAELISELMNFNGKITWDTSKPNGQPRRCVSNKKAQEKLNFKPEISLTEGLRRTIEWYTTQ